MAMFESKLKDLNHTWRVTSILLKVLSLMDPESIPLDIWAMESDLADPSRWDPR